ncbi:MAG: GNAT family N-acetyltransferase [Proteobacteria bacterium]|nr:GNAT family N-acetyltransferase [Pseudomonadota bacterium]
MKDIPRIGRQAGDDKKAEPLPKGKLREVVTYLEMRASPKRMLVPPTGRKVALMRAEQPTVHFYRYLYNTVGEPWLWWDRRAMGDSALAEVIQDPLVEIYVLYAQGVPAGFAELDRREDDEIELAYFGLLPEFIGSGLGRYFMTWAVDAAWHHEPDRLWVHTCNFDHPTALSVYQRAGFVAYDQATQLIDDPRAKGIIPASVRTPEERQTDG